LVAEDGKAVITGRHADTLAAAQHELGGPERVVAESGRADDPEHQAATVQAAIDRFGSLDIVANNAGITPVFGPLVKTDLAAARKIVEVNCIAALS
jgi:NADP-dependent 3-hydroxy acid dehydrogenase YdfG